MTPFSFPKRIFSLIPTHTPSSQYLSSFTSLYSPPSQFSHFRMFVIVAHFSTISSSDSFSYLVVSLWSVKPQPQPQGPFHLQIFQESLYPPSNVGLGTLLPIARHDLVVTSTALISGCYVYPSLDCA